MLTNAMQTLTRGFAAILLGSVFTAALVADDEFTFDPAACASCGKVCKLVCEEKTLTADCYASECTEICIPASSRQGCKHCATFAGDPTSEACSPACDGCVGCTPKAEFCWRDWFACGCARPRTVRVLTKYQAEHKIGWFHWEVVDAACCDCVADGELTKGHQIVFKPAPADAELGDVLPLSDDEWAELAAAINTEQSPLSQIAERPAGPHESADDQPNEPQQKKSLAERLGRYLLR